MVHYLKKLLFPIIITILILSQSVGQSTAQPVENISNGTCRFGITSALGTEGYDIASLGVGGYLDWGASTTPSLPDGVEYVRVLRLRNDVYSSTVANLPTWVSSYPGSIWLVGNEPDTTYGGQDALTGEVYADRFFYLATQIRLLDPTAMIGFGTIVQPTPIRMRYLDHAWTRLVSLAGSVSAASDLIDIWSIHSFILNEYPYQWGTGVPPGFESDFADAVIITNFADTYSITKFQQRIVAFRTWMNNKGERNKPLWITEYGSLLPPEDPPDGPDYVNVSDTDTTNYMLATFDYLLNATNSLTGLSDDGNRLVQRWFWYSMNDHRYNFGGSLFDPDNEKIATLVGDGFIDFQASALARLDLYPISLSPFPTTNMIDENLVDYQLMITIENDLASDTGSPGEVWIYDGDPDEDGILIAGPISLSCLDWNGGHAIISVDWLAVQPEEFHTIHIIVDPIGVSDINPTNNEVEFLVYTELPHTAYLPMIVK
jgi:hypothetical protein